MVNISFTQSELQTIATTFEDSMVDAELVIAEKASRALSKSITKRYRY